MIRVTHRHGHSDIGMILKRPRNPAACKQLQKGGVFVDKHDPKTQRTNKTSRATSQKKETVFFWSHGFGVCKLELHVRYPGVKSVNMLIVFYIKSYRKVEKYRTRPWCNYISSLYEQVTNFHLYNKYINISSNRIDNESLCYKLHFVFIVKHMRTSSIRPGSFWS